MAGSDVRGQAVEVARAVARQQAGRMTLENDIEVMQRVPLFAGLTADALRLIAFSGETHDYADGGVVFREGDPADGAFVVMHGRIDLVRERIRAKTVLATLEPGALIGELALIVPSMRPNKAVAVGAARCQLIRRATFRRVLEEYPAYALRLRTEMAARLAGLTPEIGRLATSFGRIDKPNR
jgi:CRP-like cAMP-binding protein